MKSGKHYYTPVSKLKIDKPIRRELDYFYQESDMREAHRFQNIIDLLHIDVISSRVESMHDMIREAYTVRTYIAEDYQDFKNAISNYYHYHNSTWLSVDANAYGCSFQQVCGCLDSAPNTGLSKASELMNNYRQDSKNSRTGRYGGLPTVINSVAENFKKEAVRQYVDSVIKESIDPDDYGRKVEFMMEYQYLYGAILLPGEDLLSPYEMAANIEAVINHHVGLVNAFRKTAQ